jgi:hypothetical protein
MLHPAVRNVVIGLLVFVAAFVMFGGFGSREAPVFLIPLLLLVGLGLTALLRARKGGLADAAWPSRSNPRRDFSAPDGPATIFVAASPTRAALALARIEARLWLSSMWFAVGIAFSGLTVFLFGWIWSAEDATSWPTFIAEYPVMAFPLVGMAVIGAHFAVTRSRRDRSEEIFEACPADEATRTTAHVLSGWVPSAVLAAMVVALTLLASIRAANIYGFRLLLVGDMLTAIALGWCGAALGVALARWARFVLVPVVFLFGLLFAIINVGNLGEPHWSNLRQLSPWPRYPNHDLVFTDRHVWSHLLWLIGLGGLMVLLAFVHTRRDRRMGLISAAVVVGLIASGGITTRPISDDSAARIASLVSQPAAHQTCRATGAVSVCTYRGYEQYREQVLGAVTPVVRAIDALGVAVPAVSMHQYFDGRLPMLGPEVAAALDGRGVGRPGIALGYETSPSAMNRARVVLGAHAVGLPVAAKRRVPYVAAGQARGVIALWLAGQGMSAKDQTFLASYHIDEWEHRGEDYQETAFDLGNAWPETCDGGGPAVVWSDSDLIATRRVFAQPTATVRAVLAGQWTRLVDERTTTNELLAALGLGSVPPPAQVEPVPSTC